MKNEKGFTLIELLIAAALLAVISVGLFTAFQGGIAAFQKSEEYLMTERDQEVFFMQLNHELRNAVPFSMVPFVGKQDSISFPVKIRRYTPRGVEEGVYLIEYQFKSGVLTRKETKLKKESLRGTDKKQEILFEGLGEFRFDFLNQAVGATAWDSNWSNKPYTGLPRGLRVQLRSKSSSGKNMYQILIPQGMMSKQL